MKQLASILCLLAIMFIALNGCEKKSVDNTADKLSFEIIEEQVFATSCATTGCHASTTDASYAQHGLVLSKGVAFTNLIGKMAKNPAAAALKLQLVKPFDADNSFLFHKISCQMSHHGGSTANFGNQMPMGGNYLTQGQVDFIRRWINAGATATEKGINVSILKDSSACQQDIMPLTVPAAGKGFQMKIDLFDVPKNFEREVFLRANTPNAEPVYVNRIEMRGRSNSHHFVVYGFRNSTVLPQANVLRDIRNLDGSINLKTAGEMQNHIFFGGGTDVNSDVTLPPGVALKVDPLTPLDLNAHYFNKTNLLLKGENYVNFHTIPVSNVQFVAKTLDLNNLDISIPAGQRRTISKTFTFNAITRVVMLTSHFHRFGEKFNIKIAGGPRNGELVYTNTDWLHPFVKSFPTPIVLQPGEGLTSEVTYFNSSTKAVGFGLTSEDEMNIIFGYYY